MDRTTPGRRTMELETALVKLVHDHACFAASAVSSTEETPWMRAFAQTDVAKVPETVRDSHREWAHRILRGILLAAPAVDTELIDELLRDIRSLKQVMLPASPRPGKGEVPSAAWPVATPDAMKSPQAPMDMVQKICEGAEWAALAVRIMGSIAKTSDTTFPTILAESLIEKTSLMDGMKALVKVWELEAATADGQAPARATALRTCAERLKTLVETADDRPDFEVTPPVQGETTQTCLPFTREGLRPTGEPRVVGTVQAPPTPSREELLEKILASKAIALKLPGELPMEEGKVLPVEGVPFKVASASREDDLWSVILERVEDGPAAE